MRRAGIPSRRGDQRIVSVASLLGSLLQWHGRSDTGITIGTGVSAWADLSGKGRHATQSTGSLQPAYVPNAFAGRPALRFDGSDDYMIIPSNLVHGFASASVWVVIKNDGAAYDSNDRPFGNTGGPTNYFGLTYGQVTSGYPDCGISDGSANVFVRGPSSRSGSSGGMVFDARMVSGNSQAWDNGVAGPNVATAYGGNLSCNVNKYIGAMEAAGSPTAHFHGDLFELVVAAPAPPVPIQDQVRALLRRGYAL